MRFRPLAAALLVAMLGVAWMAGAASRPTPVPVTDETVFTRVTEARNAADHRALAAYYRAKSAAEAARIEYFDHLFRTYMQLPVKTHEVMQHQARLLLKGARMARKHFDLLASAHMTMAAELAE